MPRILVMEGNTARVRARLREHGMRMSAEVYAEAIRADRPDADIEVVNAADEGEPLPDERNLARYDGFVISGSAFHAYDRRPAVERQIELLGRAAAAGLPILASCWGLQIAAVAAGGEVAPCAKGREFGFARAITPTPEGRTHPMLAGREPTYDAPCVHEDEVVRLPDGATLLAGNAHSPVQAAVIPLGRSEVWAVQYHPEFDLRHMADIHRLTGPSLLAEGRFADQAELDEHAAKLDGLAADPTDAGLARRLGLDGDVTDGAARRTEITAWLRALAG